MDENVEQGDCCPLYNEGLEEKSVAFGPRTLRPDSFDAYVDKESARARARMLGCIGIRQYSSTTGGTVWMPCSNESDYRKVTKPQDNGRRYRRRTKSASPETMNVKALGTTIGSVANVNTNPMTAIDADLDGLVLEGLPFINMGRGVPDPTPGGVQRLAGSVDSSFVADNDQFAMAAMRGGRNETRRISDRTNFELSMERDGGNMDPMFRQVSESFDRKKRANTRFAEASDDQWNNFNNLILDQLFNSELFDFDDSEIVRQELSDWMQSVAAEVSDIVDRENESLSVPTTSRFEKSQETASRFAAKVLGTVSAVLNNPPEFLSQNEAVSQRLVSTMMEQGAANVGRYGGRPGLWAFLVQAIAGGALATQKAWELLARVFGAENNTGWIPEPTGRTVEALAPSLENDRRESYRRSALGRIGRLASALAVAGYQLGEGSALDDAAVDLARTIDDETFPNLDGDSQKGPEIDIEALARMSGRMKKATGLKDEEPRKKQRKKTPRAYADDALFTRNRMDLAGIPGGLLDTFDAANVPEVPRSYEQQASLITSGGVDGTNGLNATLLYDSLSSEEFLRSFVAPENSSFGSQLSHLIIEGRMPKLADAILGMSPESVQNFLGLNPRQLISAARSARKTIRPETGWIARIEADPFETVAHMMRAKDYHVSAIANGSSSPELTDAVDELVGSNVSETAAIFSSLVGKNKEKLVSSYDGSLSLAEAGNSLIMTARNLIASATENDSIWVASRSAIDNTSATLSDDPKAAMVQPVVRYGRNYPRHRRKSGDWSPIANKIRDRVLAYKRRYGAPAANAADLGKFVDFSYPELLDEASELMDVMKEKIEFGSLKMIDYASDGWRDRDRAELALDEFDASNLESIFDPGKKMGLYKAIGVILSAAARVAPSREEQEGVMELIDEVGEWSFTALPLYSEPKIITSRQRGIFPEFSDGPSAGMAPPKKPDGDVRSVVESPSPSDKRVTTASRRVEAKLIQRANELIGNQLPTNVAARLRIDPMGPVIDIAETFFQVAENGRLGQDQMAALYERTSEIMSRMISDVADSKKRTKLASMFKDALEEISGDIDDGNELFFSIVGNDPARNVGRLARRLSVARQIPEREPEAGMATESEFEPTEESLPMEIPAEQTTNLRPITEADKETIYGNVYRLYESIRSSQPLSNPDDGVSLAEKLSLGAKNDVFVAEDAVKRIIEAELGPEVLSFSSGNPDAGVVEEVLWDLEEAIDVLFDELNVAPNVNTAEQVASVLRRSFGISGSDAFNELLRYLVDDMGRSDSHSQYLAAAASRYLTNSSIRNRIEEIYPGLYEILDGNEPVAGMSAASDDALTDYVNSLVGETREDESAPTQNELLDRLIETVRYDSDLEASENRLTLQAEMMFRSLREDMPNDQWEAIRESVFSTIDSMYATLRSAQPETSSASADALTDYVNAFMDENRGPETTPTLDELLDRLVETVRFDDDLERSKNRLVLQAELMFRSMREDTPEETLKAAKESVMATIDSMYSSVGDDPFAAMAGPLMDRIRDRIVHQREIRKLGGLAQMNDQADYMARQAEAMRRRLISMSSPGGFLDLLTRGISDERSPLAVRRLAQRTGGLENYFRGASDQMITAFWRGLSDFVNDARSEVNDPNSKPYRVMRLAVKTFALEQDPDFRPEQANFSDEELLSRVNATSYSSLLPDDSLMEILPTDIDSVPSVKAKAAAALEVLAMDRAQLVSLLTNEDTTDEARRRVMEQVSPIVQATRRAVQGRPGKIDYVPTPVHMEQIAVIDSITPLDSESLVAAVDSFSDEQLDSVNSGKLTTEAQLLFGGESYYLQMISGARKMIALRELHSMEPEELRQLDNRISSFEAEEGVSELVVLLSRAIALGDQDSVSSIISQLNPLDDKIQSDFMKLMWAYGRNSRNESVLSALPPSIDDATNLAIRKARAVATLKSQPDGGKTLARKTIDNHPKGGKGYDMVRVIPEPTESERRILNAGEAIANYDGSPESARSIIDSLNDHQLEQLRKNYIIPSILQKMDRESWENRMDQSSVAETRARIDNIARRLESMTFGMPDEEITHQEVVSRTEEALIDAFGDRYFDIALLSKEERVLYGDIVDYYVSGGNEKFSDPKEYESATRRLQSRTTPTLTYNVDDDISRVASEEQGSDQVAADDEDFWSEAGIDPQAGMTVPRPPIPPTPPSDGGDSEKRKLRPITEEIAVKIFGDQVRDWIKGGEFLDSPIYPTTSNPDRAEYSRKAIAALYQIAKGKGPVDIAERMRTDGTYSAAQEIFGSLVEATRNIMNGAGWDIPQSFDPLSKDLDPDIKDEFLAVMQEYLSLHMALGNVLPIPSVARDDGSEYDIKETDFQLTIGRNITDWRLTYNPEGSFSEIREQESGDESVPDEFSGDPSEHPTIQAIDRTVSKLKRQFPYFSDWLEQSNRYSRMLGGQHYEKNNIKFGDGIVDRVASDPSSMDLEKVVRAVAETWRHSPTGDSARLFADAASLAPDPDRVSPFPTLESYPDPDRMVGSDIPKDRIAKQKRIAVSTAKASAAARESWWNMFSGSSQMDEYEIAAVSKTTDGDNFHPTAILSGLRKYARDNGISDSQFDSIHSVATSAATGRYNSVALQKTITALNDIAMNSRGGIAGELMRLDQLLRQLENQNKELSRHYQDRIRARIQTLYSSWGSLTAMFEKERRRLMNELSLGRLTAQEVVDGIRNLWIGLQPAAFSAINQIGDLSRRADASARARNAVEIQMNEVRQRVEEIRQAVQIAIPDMDARMKLLRGVNNGLSHLQDDPSGLADDANAGMSVGSIRYGAVGQDQQEVMPRRTMLTSNEKMFSSIVGQINDLSNQLDIDRIGAAPNLRSAMLALRGSTGQRMIPNLTTGSPAEIVSTMPLVTRMLAADIEAEAAAKTVMGDRYVRFSDIALRSLPAFTSRIAQDVISDGYAATMATNNVGEVDIESAMIMLAESTKNVKNFAVYNTPDNTAKVFGVTPEMVSDAIATESLLKKTSSVLRSAQDYASRLSTAYSPESVARMTANRFPLLTELGEQYLSRALSDDFVLRQSEAYVNTAIALNKFLPLNPQALSSAFGISEDIARFVSAASTDKDRSVDMQNSLPSDWNFMTYRDRQDWLMSESATNSLGRVGVSQELSKLQRQIEQFGSLDGPYPALARNLTGNGSTRNSFGRNMILPNGMSPMYSSSGLSISDLSKTSRYQFSSLVGIVPGIEQMSDRAMARFLNTGYDVVSALRSDGMGVSRSAASRLAEAFNKSFSEVWPVEDLPQTDPMPGHFLWLASTWDRSMEALSMYNDGANREQVAASIANGDFIARKVEELINDGTMNAFFDAVGTEEITPEDAQNYVANTIPRSRKETVAVLASAGYKENEIVEATGINANTVRNSLHELRKQGAIPDAVGSPSWISANSEFVVSDFNQGMSKRSLMKKYGIGARTLDGILSETGETIMDDAIADGPVAAMASRRLPDETEMADGPSQNWRDEYAKRADGSMVDPSTQKPPAIVGNPFIDPTVPAALSVDADQKDEAKIRHWRDAISDWISMSLEGGFFLVRTDNEQTPQERILRAILGDVGKDGHEPTRIQIGETPEGDPLELDAKEFELFQIATRANNPSMILFSFGTTPALVRDEFNRTGMYRGLLPTLRNMIQATYDKYFKAVPNATSGTDESQDFSSTLMFDEPELPENIGEDLRLKLWQLRQMMRSPNLVDAPPMFQEGDEIVMRKLIPIMAAADETNMMKMKYGSGAIGTMDDPSSAIPATTEGDDYWEQGGAINISGVPMFSNLLISAVVQGSPEAKKIVDELSPRQIMLANWVYSIYTLMDPLAETFGDMMPGRLYKSPNTNIPEEANSRQMIGDKYHLPTKEMDDQYFAFAFDSLFQALRDVSENPWATVMESVPSGDWDTLAAGSESGKSQALVTSAKVLARIFSDALATHLYRRAVQSMAKDESGDGVSPFYAPEANVGWFRFARPRMDAFGYWSMYGPNVVYSGDDGKPYVPGWNDSQNVLREMVAGVSGVGADVVAADNAVLEELQEQIEQAPGKYWWETEGAYGELTDEQLLSMHPEEFADYVSAMSIFHEYEDESQLLRTLMGNVKELGLPAVQTDKFDEWIGSILLDMQDETVTKEKVLAQLKEFFPWLDVNRMDDIYPVTGKSFDEAIKELAESVGDLDIFTAAKISQMRPHTNVAAEVLGSSDSLSTLEPWKRRFAMPIIKAILSDHRTNMSMGYRQITAFARGLRSLEGDVGNLNDVQMILMQTNEFLRGLLEEGQINGDTFFKLSSEIHRLGGAAFFADAELGNSIMKAMAEADMSNLENFMGLILQNVSAQQEGEEVPTPNAEQIAFLESYRSNMDRARELLGDRFESHIRNGMYGSVKTIGQAMNEIAPFLEATERAKKRKALIPRYKREVLDPVRESLMTDADRLAVLPTFNQWLDANDFQDLTYDKGPQSDGPTAAMSSLTRAVISRYTDDAASSVIEAYEEATNTKSQKLNLGHLVVGAWRTLMSGSEAGAYLNSLRRMGIDAKRVSEALVGVTSPAEGVSPADKPTGFTKAAQRTMIGAIKAASRRGDEFIDLGDVLMASFDEGLRGSDDDGIMEALASSGISPYVLAATIAASRATGGRGATVSEGPQAGMGSSRSAINKADKSDALTRNKLLSYESWFNSGRAQSILSGTATDGELVDEFERLLNVYHSSLSDKTLDAWDFRGGQSPFGDGAIRTTNSLLIHGLNGQEPSDLVGAIRHAYDRAEALVTEDQQVERLQKLATAARLYFDNDEHLDPSAGMNRDFSSMMEPISDLFARNPKIDQRNYYTGIYGDPDMSETELRKAADFISLGTPFDVSKNLSAGTEDDVNWSANEWSFNKDGTFIQGADSVILRMKNSDLSTAEIAMISRKSGPFRDAMSLVGGLRDGNEDLMTTASRETMEEVGVSVEGSSQSQYLGYIESPDWDPRFVNGVRVGGGLFVVPWETQLSASSDAAAARWVPLSEIAAGSHTLAFGHAEWIRRAVAAMQIDYNSDPYGDLRLSIANRLSILSKAARVRNQKIISRINSVRRATGKKLFPEGDRMPHPMMPWGNRVARSVWRFGSDENPQAGMGQLSNQIDDSLPRELGLLDVQSSMPASLLVNGSPTDSFYGVSFPRSDKDMFSGWADERRVDQLWRPYVERSLERARVNDVPNDQQRPSVYILGGASASGKSTARKNGLSGIPNYDRAVVADPDDAKIMMPETRLWYARRLPTAAALAHGESRAVTAVMARAATEAGLDLVYDTSGQFNDGYDDIKNWRDRGYNIVAHYFFAPESVLQKRNEERFQETGRQVPPSIVSTIQFNLKNMLPGFVERGLFDELYIWDSEKDPSRPLLVGQILAGQLGEPVNLEVKHPYLFRYLFTDRTAPDGGKIEPRKTKLISIPTRGR